MVSPRSAEFFPGRSLKLPASLLIGLAGILAAASLSCAQQAKPPKTPVKKTDPVRRVRPSDVPGLPPEFVEKLNTRGCTIPQFDAAVSAGSQPGPAANSANEVTNDTSNVIHGEFTRKGQQDWAVLCSNGRVSTIVIYWARPTSCPSSLARLDDAHYLKQPAKGKTLRYSRSIRTFGESDIDGRPGTSGLRPLAHDGIDDRFVGKSSAYFYCNDGKWRIFPAKEGTPAKAGSPAAAATSDNAVATGKPTKSAKRNVHNKDSSPQ
jgi:hypothetical protein